MIPLLEVCIMTQVPREFWNWSPQAAACIYDIVSKTPPGDCGNHPGWSHGYPFALQVVKRLEGH